MPSYILKPEPDTDFYVVWSSVVDGPTCWGDKESVTEQLSWYGPNSASPDRFDRADTTGTSANSGEYGWTETAPLLTRELTPDLEDWYLVKRENLQAMCAALDAGETPLPFLTPLPDEERG